MKLCVLGLGYIGLPTSAMFAKAGLDVLGVDINESVVKQLNEGRILIEEPALDDVVKEVVSQKKLRASLTPEKADVFIVAVPTPMSEDKKPDMSYVEAATRSLLPYLEEGAIIILESTSPPRTVEDLMLPILAESGLEIGKQLFVAHSPERVIPGRILTELVENDRIVGGINSISAEKVKTLYQTFVKGNIYTTDATTAEMCKLMENTYRGVNIALANELAIICEHLNMNAWEIIRYANHHPRVNLLQPGPGVGGHCIAIDPWFVVDKAPDEATLIHQALTINESMPHHLFEKIKSILHSLRHRKITLLGMTYKPDVDDIRESPILRLISLLEEIEGIDLQVVDPHVSDYRYLNSSVEDAFQESDLVILCVHHQAFLDYDFTRLFATMPVPRLLDIRHFLPDLQTTIPDLEYHLLGLGEQ